MKFNFKYALFFFGLLVLASCGNEYDIDDNFDLEELPNYVAFGDGSTNNAILDDVTANEDAVTASFIIEVPAGTLSDVTVDFEYSGSAVEGTNYTIDGGSNGSGTIVLETDENDFLDRDQVDLVINLIDDGVYTKDPFDLVITLVGASNAEGPLAVGRGGTDFLKSANLFIKNTDCFPDFSGDYSYETTEYTCKNAGDPNLTGIGTFTMSADGMYTFNDFSFGVASSCAVAFDNPDSFNFCLFDDGVSITNSMDSKGYSISNISLDGANMTISYGNSDIADMGTTTITRTDGQDWPADLVQ